MMEKLDCLLAIMNLVLLHIPELLARNCGKTYHTQQDRLRPVRSSWIAMANVSPRRECPSCA